MKIIHISPSYKPAYCYGGPIQSISLLCEALASRNIELEVLTTTANGRTELNLPTQVPIFNGAVKTIYFKRKTGDHWHFCPDLLLFLWRKNYTKNTIIHIHSWWNLTAVLSCLIAKTKGLKVVLSPRGMLGDYTFSHRNSILKKIFHQVIGKQLIRYTQIHCTSNMERQELLQFQTFHKISTIPNLIPSVHSGILGNPPNDIPIFKMIFLSRIDPKKGLEILFNALSKLKYKWVLTIAGDGPTSYISTLKSLAKELGITNTINWLGRVDDANKYKLIADHHLMVLFSYHENFANVVLESLLIGTPIAISDRVGLADYVKANNLGWVSSLDTTAIISTLHHAYQNENKRHNIKKNAPYLIKEHYNQAFLTQQYINLYKIVNEKP